nr:hypothetical protein [Lachnospiraceae bacterium]
WIEWLEYNITRALGKCRDEDDRQLGIAEVMNTLSRIRYIHDKESNIRQVLHMISTERRNGSTAGIVNGVIDGKIFIIYSI